MAAHLSHKIRWDFLADYLTPHSDEGITLPVGDCGRIHPAKRKEQIQIEMRKYITDDMVCTDDNCQTTGEQTFRKSNKKGPPFKKGCKRDEKKLLMFTESFCNAVNEFASTELNSPVKEKETVKENMERTAENSSLTTYCNDCNKFISCLEFGDKQRLFDYSDSELNNILRCQHGGQAVGNSISFFLYHILRFYVYSNVIVYLDLKEESQWPEFMRPKSYFRGTLLYACDGQTFLPYSRGYLANAMIDVAETRELSKRLFRAIYLYAMVKMKLNSSYKAQDEFDSDDFIYR